MGNRIYIIAIIFILFLILVMAGKQLIGDFYYRMAQREGLELNKAIGYLEKCIALDDKNALFHFSLGRTYLAKGLNKGIKAEKRNEWIRKSIFEFHKAIELEPCNSDYHFHLGISYGCLSCPPPIYHNMIQQSFTRTVVLNPTEVRHLYSIGTYYLNEYQRLKHIGWTTGKIGRTYNRNYLADLKESCQLYYRKLVNVDEEYLNSILGKWFSVSQDCVDLRSLVGDTARSRVVFARFLTSKGMWEEAKSEYIMAINLEPFNPIYYAEFANVFSIKGDFENAITWWKKQKMLNPQDEGIYLSLCDAFMRLNRFNEAVQELHELINLSPDNVDYCVKLIRTLLVARKIDEAVEQYGKVVGMNKGFSESSYDMVYQYQRKGDYPEIVRILNEVLASAADR